VVLVTYGIKTTGKVHYLALLIREVYVSLYYCYLPY